MRATGGPSILKDLSNERVAIDLDDAVRMNVHALAVQVFVGGEHETQSVENMTRLVDAGYRYGMPVLGVTAVGKELTRDARYLGLATRICAELGAQFVKTYYVEEGFERVTAGCPVPIVMAGGKKLPELEALTMALPGGVRGRRRRRHGPEHLPERRAGGDDPGRRGGRARRLEPRRGARALPASSREGRALAGARLSSLHSMLLGGGPSLSVGVMSADLLHLGDELDEVTSSRGAAWRMSTSSTGCSAPG